MQCNPRKWNVTLDLIENRDILVAEVVIFWTGRSETGGGGGDDTWALLVLTSLSISYLTALREGIVCFLTRNVLNKVREGLVFLPRFGKDKLALLVPRGSVGVPDNVKP